LTTSVLLEDDASYKDLLRCLTKVESELKEAGKGASIAALDSQKGLKLTVVAQELAKQAAANRAQTNQSQIDDITASIAPLSDPNGLLRQTLIKAGVFVSSQLPSL